MSGLTDALDGCLGEAALARTWWTTWPRPSGRDGPPWRRGSASAKKADAVLAWVLNRGKG